MIDPEVCCADEEEFEEKIRLSKEAQLRISGKPKTVEEAAPDPIEEADKKRKKENLETDESFLRATKLDVTTIFYLEDRMKNCYPLKAPPESLAPLVACFKEGDRSPLECECVIRDYLKEATTQKEEFAEDVSRLYRQDKSKGKKPK